MPVASGSSRTRAAGRATRVLPLALAGLAALSHRGAFGADGVSSDGAGVALPLDPLVAGADRAGDAAARPGIVSLFLPRAAGRAEACPGARRDGVRSRPAWRSPRGGPCRSMSRALGAAAADSRPAVRPGDRRAPVTRRRRPAAARPTTPSSGGWSSPAGGSRPRRGRPAASSPRSSIPSASARTIVYKGLVAGGRLPSSIRTCQRRSTSATRSSTSATPRTRIRSGGSPSRSARSPTTARSTRSVATASRSAAGPRDAGDPADRRRHCSRPARSSPPTAPIRSSLDEALELLTSTGWDLTAGPARRDPRGARAPPRAASARRDAAPPDGRVPRAVGRAGRDRLRRRPAGRRARRPERAAAGGLRGDPRPARRGRVRGRRRAVHRRRDGPARPPRAGRAAAGRAAAAGRSSRTPRRRPGSLRTLPDPRRAAADPRGPRRRRGGRGATRRHADRPRPALPRRPRRRARPARHQDDGARRPRAAVEHGRRHADRRAAAGSTGRSPTTSARRSPRSRTRPSIPSASASSWTCGSSSAVGRRCSAGRRAAPRTVRLQRPIVADLDGPARGRSRGPGHDPDARCDLGPGDWPGRARGRARAAGCRGRSRPPAAARGPRR